MKTSSAPEQVSFILVPTIRLIPLQITPFHGIIAWADEAGHAGNLSLDRGQAVSLGAALMKLGRQLQREDGLEVPESGEHGGLYVPGS